MNSIDLSEKEDVEYLVKDPGINEEDPKIIKMGAYSPKDKCIEIYYKVIEKYVKKEDQELIYVSTLIHKMCHAYYHFNALNEENTGADPGFEKTMAEFGVLTLLKIFGNSWYDKAIENIRSKYNCGFEELKPYGRGAILAEMYLNPDNKAIENAKQLIRNHKEGIFDM